MAKKTYVINLKNELSRRRSDYFYVYTTTSVERSGISYSSSPKTVGIYYSYYREKYTSEVTYISAGAETYLTIYSADDSIGLVAREPIAANNYTFRLIVGDTSGETWGHSTKICFLTKEIFSVYETEYNYLASLSGDITIPANTTFEYTGEISRNAVDNILKYGLAFIPNTQANLDEISNYININTTEYGSYIYDDSVKVSNHPYISYSVENLASPGTASTFSPSAASILVSNRDNTISWKYTQEFEAPQYYVGITATYLDTGETQEICRKQIISAESGSTVSYTIPAGTLRTGNVRLTVSAMPHDSATYYAEDDAIWTSGASVDYTVKSTPEAGDVSCDGKPNPTVSWESTTQAAFQVRFGDYDSGVIAGSETSYTVPRIFHDGNYAVSIRTATAAGEWSDWTEDVYVNIANIAPAGTVILTAAHFDMNVQLTWESTAAADNYAVYRDGVLIAVQTGNAFIDRYSSGQAEYVVYAVSDGYYTESNRITFALNLRYDIISTDGGYTYKFMRYTTAPKSQTDLYTDDVTYQYYAGREKPIAISSGHNERIKRFAYVFKKRADALFLRSMSGKAVLIKTTRGCVIYGILGELQITEARITTASFSVREIYREGEDVEYVS